MSLKNKIWRIYTGDYSDVGYTLGTAWAKQGKPRNAWGFAYIWHKNIINQFWQAKYSDQTLKQSFYQGYDDKHKAQTFANTQAPITPLIPQGAIMTAKNYNAMLTGLRTAKKGIEIQIDNLESYLNAYDKKMANMLEQNFLSDYVNKISSANGLKRQIEVLKNILTAINLELSTIQGKIEEDKANAD